MGSFRRHEDHPPPCRLRACREREAGRDRRGLVAQTNTKHKFRLELLDADGRAVPTPDGETIRAEGEFEAGRPAGLRPGTPVDAPLVVPFGPLVLDDGRYEIRLTIDDETKEDWFVAFTVRQTSPGV